MLEPKFEKISEDERGANWRVVLGDRELLLIFTKKGYRRGGHSHDRNEVSLLLMGKAKYKKRVDGSELNLFHEAGDFLYNQAGEVHMMEALEDNFILDWKVTAKIGETKTTNDPAMRKLVTKSRTG